MANNGAVKQRDGKNVLEVLLYEHTASKKTFLPGNVIRLGEQLPAELGQELASAIYVLPVRASAMRPRNEHPAECGRRAGRVE